MKFDGNITEPGFKIRLAVSNVVMRTGGDAPTENISYGEVGYLVG